LVDCEHSGMFGLRHEIDEMKHLFGHVNPLAVQGCDIMLL